MANWVKCQGYTENRESLWVNLDHVALIRGHDNGSVLVVASGDGNSDGFAEYVVWDRPEDIFAMRGK
jgi:hypothetical protein